MNSRQQFRIGAMSARLVRLFSVILGTAVMTLGTSPQVYAQDASTGTIRGRVQNADTGQYLPNAVVAVEGTGLQALTDDSGTYELRNVPAGSVTLKTSYVGKKDLTLSAAVTAGQTTTRDITISSTSVTPESDTLSLDPYEVQAERYRSAREIAINAERNSINIKNVVSVDTYGIIPNNNVGEFVKFMPGIQIDYGASNGNNQGYSDNDASSVSVRGFGPEETAILIDGMPVTSTVPGNLTRVVGLDQLSINNAARVELIKVATPDMPNNSLGGQINLITRSAFEYSKPVYTARAFLTMNSLETALGKSSGPTDKHTYKITPAIDLSATYPLSATMGVSFTLFAANEFNETYRAQTEWNGNHSAAFQNGSVTNFGGRPSSLENPVMTRYRLTHSPRMTDRISSNVKFDWRPTPSQLLRANVQYGKYDAVEAQRRLDVRPTVAAGADWDGSKTVGTTANSTLAMTVTDRDRVGDTKSAQLQYSLNFGGWTISAAGSYSQSESDFQDAENGHFSEVAFNLNPGRVAMYGFKDGRPSAIQTFTRGTNLPLDYTDFSRWAFDGTTAKSGQSHNESTIGLYKLDIERDLSFLPFIGANSLAIKFGARRDEEKTSKSGRGSNYREILRPGASYTVGEVVDHTFTDRSPGFGLPVQQWGSAYTLFEVNQARNIFYVPDFDEPTNTRVENYNSFVGQLKSIKETRDAWYAQLSGRFFKNRLSFIGGLRQERNSRTGYSPFTDTKWNFVKRADGSLYTDAAHPTGVQFDIGNGSIANGVLTGLGTSNRPLFFGTPFGRSTLTAAEIAQGTLLRQNLTAAGISFPSVPFGPSNNALASRMLQFQPARPVSTKRTGDPSYSLNLSYELTKKIVLKGAWSRAFGLPKLEDGPQFGLISGTNDFSINDFTSSEETNNSGFDGEIKLANPNQRPKVSDNWDFEVSYYTETGGKFTAAYFYKTVTNQPISLSANSSNPVFHQVLPILGLDPVEYERWRLVTSATSNSDQKEQGMEFEIRQDFGILGNWGKSFQGFVSYAVNDLDEPGDIDPVILNNPDGTTTVIPTTSRSIEERANKFGGAGLQYAGRRLTVQVRSTWRNRDQTGTAGAIVGGNVIRVFRPAETRVDVSLSYMLSRRYSLFASARDVFNGQRREEYIDDQGRIPDYARLNDFREFGTVWTLGVNGTW